jgi:hypothetical protein
MSLILPLHSHQQRMTITHSEVCYVGQLDQLAWDDDPPCFILVSKSLIEYLILHTLSRLFTPVVHSIDELSLQLVSHLRR